MSRTALMLHDSAVSRLTSNSSRNWYYGLSVAALKGCCILQEHMLATAHHGDDPECV